MCFFSLSIARSSCDGKDRAADRDLSDFNYYYDIVGPTAVLEQIGSRPSAAGDPRVDSASVRIVLK